MAKKAKTTEAAPKQQAAKTAAAKAPEATAAPAIPAQPDTDPVAVRRAAEALILKQIDSGLLSTQSLRKLCARKIADALAEKGMLNLK